MKQGPNVKKLICHKMALIIAPSHVSGGVPAVVDAIAKPGNLEAVARAATAWVEQVINLVKTAPHNSYGDDDEAIAGEILSLRQIEERNRRTSI
jgi:hypothetical protein